MLRGIKPPLIFLPLNAIAGLLYCMLTKKMSVVSYSNILTVIGGAYLVIGGMSFMGGMFSELDYTQNFSRSYRQRIADNVSRGRFSATALAIGICTILISFAVSGIK